MDELKRYVDRLFAGYQETKENKELKEEILSNLEAKAADSMESGLSRDEALTLAMRSIQTVDSLIEGNQPVYISLYKTELFQSALLYLLIAWILTIPFRLLYTGIMANNLLTVAVMVCAIIYLIIYPRKDEAGLNAVSTINLKRLSKLRKAAWTIWGLYVLAAVTVITIKQFGSAIWFGRAVSIDGPYQFAVVVTSYAIPFITVILPLLFARAYKLAKKHEVKR